VKTRFLPHRVLAVLALILLDTSSTWADQWRPLCIEGSACVYDTGFSYAEGPLIVGDTLWLRLRKAQIPRTGPEPVDVAIFSFNTKTQEIILFGQNVGYVNDASAIHMPNGTVWGSGVFYSSDGTQLPGQVNWTGLSSMEFALSVKVRFTFNPPVLMNGNLYMSLQFRGWSTSIFKSNDGGYTWAENPSFTGTERYGLIANPEEAGLWSIEPKHHNLPPRLWESFDDGASWVQVDDGSFPDNTVRVVHDPDNAISYALSGSGLYVSHNRGVSWVVTTLQQSVFGMAFIDRTPPLSRTLVAGTDSGVKISFDEGSSWLDMSDGLLNIPHTVTHHNGVLIATSNAGYFTCNSVDCGGEAQAVPEEEERGMVTVTEFYNTELGHYFMTPSEEEANGIDQGSAGPGWVRTGETFQAWSQLGNSYSYATHLCRFYGSVNPGPNSHFFTISSQECSALLALEQTTLATKPRWNFEQYSFMAIPSSLEAPQPCPEDSLPIYRAYNGGFARGEDSNHRYVTDPALLEPMVLEGWVDEGVVFCAARP